MGYVVRLRTGVGKAEGYGVVKTMAHLLLEMMWGTVYCLLVSTYVCLPP